MKKLEAFYADSNWELENKIRHFAKSHNLINVSFYEDTECSFSQKRAMVIYQ